MLIALFAVFALIFIVLQAEWKDNATVPPRIIGHRSVASSAWFVFAAGAGVNVMEYYVSPSHSFLSATHSSHL